MNKKDKKLLISLGFFATPIVTAVSVSCGIAQDQKDIKFNFKPEDLEMDFIGNTGEGSYKLNSPLNIENVTLFHAIKRNGQQEFGDFFIQKPYDLRNGDELKLVWKPLDNPLYSTINGQKQYEIIQIVKGLLPLDNSPLKNIELEDVQNKLSELFKANRQLSPSDYLKQNNTKNFSIEETTFNIHTIADDKKGIINFNIISASKGQYILKAIEFWDWNLKLNVAGFKNEQDLKDVEDQKVIDSFSKDQIQTWTDDLFNQNDNPNNPTKTPSEAINNNTEKEILKNGAKIIVTLTPNNDDGKIRIAVKSIVKNNVFLSPQKLQALSGSIGGFLTSANKIIKDNAIMDNLNAITKIEIEENIDPFFTNTNERPSVLTNRFYGQQYWFETTNKNPSTKNNIRITVEFTPNDTLGEISYKVLSITKEGVSRDVNSFATFGKTYSGFLTIQQIFNKIDRNLILQEIKKNLNITIANLGTKLPSTILKQTTSHEIKLFATTIKYKPIANDVNGEISYTIESIEIDNHKMPQASLVNLGSKITGLNTNLNYWSPIIANSYKSYGFIDTLRSAIEKEINLQLKKILAVTNINNITPTKLVNSITQDKVNFSSYFSDSQNNFWGSINYKAKFHLIPDDVAKKILVKVDELSTKDVQLPTIKLNDLNLNVLSQNDLHFQSKFNEITIDWIYIAHMTKEEILSMVNNKFINYKNHMASVAKFLIRGPSNDLFYFTTNDGLKIGLKLVRENDSIGELAYEIQSLRKGDFFKSIVFSYLDDEMDGFKTTKDYQSYILEQIRDDTNNTEINKVIKAMIRAQVPNKTLDQITVNELNLAATHIYIDKDMQFSYNDGNGNIEQLKLPYTIKAAINWTKDPINKEINFVINKLEIEGFDSVAISVNIIDKITGFKASAKEDNQASINALTFKDIQKEINKLFANNLNKTATNAAAIVVDRTVIVDGVKVGFVLGTPDDVTKKIPYTISKLEVDSIERVPANLEGGFKGEITGFQTQAEIDDRAILDSITATDIKTKIDELFASHLDKTAANARIAVTNTTVDVKGANVTFSSTSNDIDKKITYVITKIAIGSQERTILDLKNLGGEVTGFKKTQAEIDNQAIVDNITASDIKTEMDKLFVAHLDKTATNARDGVYDTTITIRGATVTFSLGNPNDVAKKIPYTIVKIEKGNTERLIADMPNLGGEVLGFKTQAEIDNANKLILDSVTKDQIKNGINNWFSPSKKDKLASKWKSDLGTNSAIAILSNGVKVTFAWGNADDNNQTLDYVVSKVEKDGKEKLDLSNLNGTIVGFAIKIGKPTEMNWSIISGTSGTAGDGVLIKSEADLANTTHLFKWKPNASGTFNTFSIANDFIDGYWIQITWTANDGYVFDGGSKTYVEEFLVKVYTATEKAAIQEIRNAIYTNGSITTTNIKNKIELLYDKTKMATEALTSVINKEVDINGIIVKFTALANDVTQEIAYTVTELSKDGYTYNNQTNLTQFNGKVAGFVAKVTRDAAKVLIDNKMIGTNQADTKGLVKIAVETLFSNKNQTIASAIIAVGTLEVTLVDGVKVSFIANPKANDATTLEFKVTKLSKDGYDYDTNNGTQAALDAVGGEITGFKTLGDIAKTLIDAVIATNKDVTKTAIEVALRTKLNVNDKTPAEVKTTFDGLVDKFVTLAGNVLYEGIKVEFTVSVNATTNTTLDFAITKLSKDGYVLINGVDVLNGEINNLKNPGYDAAKILIDASIATNKDATKVAIVDAIKVKLAVNGKTATEAKAAFDALAANQRFVVLANNIKVEFTVNVSTTTNNTLEFKIIKLSKDGYEYDANNGVQAVLDAISGGIGGFN